MSQQFCLRSDGDGHWYCIPYELATDFEAWNSEDTESDTFDPDRFNEFRIDGPWQIVFTNWYEV